MSHSLRGCMESNGALEVQSTSAFSSLNQQLNGVLAGYSIERYTQSPARIGSSLQSQRPKHMFQYRHQHHLGRLIWGNWREIEVIFQRHKPCHMLQIYRIQSLTERVFQNGDFCHRVRSLPPRQEGDSRLPRQKYGVYSHPESDLSGPDTAS